MALKSQPDGKALALRCSPSRRTCVQVDRAHLLFHQLHLLIPPIPIPIHPSPSTILTSITINIEREEILPAIHIGYGARFAFPVEARSGAAST